MDTHEFQFPGGSAVITTTTGGTRDAPDFCVRRPDPSTWNEGRHAAQIFAAEILKLANRVEELESALAAAGEERENMEIRLSGRIAELEAEVERRAAENIAVQDKSRSVTETLLAVAALFKGTPEAKIAKLEAEIAGLRKILAERHETVHRLAIENSGLRTDNLSLVNSLEAEGAMVVTLQRERESLLAGQFPEVAERIQALAEENEKLRTDLAAALKTGEELRAGVAAELKEKRGCLKDNERLRADLAVAIRTREEQAERLGELQVALHTAYESEREHRKLAAARGLRLFRLDALLSSEDAPNELVDMIGRLAPTEESTFRGANKIWQWFRDLNAPGSVAEDLTPPPDEKPMNAANANQEFDEVYRRAYGTVLEKSKVTPEKLWQETVRELNREPVTVRTGNASWYAGLSMEEVNARIQAGTAPGSSDVGGCVSVPDGFFEWMAKENAKLKTELDATIKYSINSNDAKTGRSLAAILAQHCLEGENVTEALNRIIREREARHKTIMQFMAENVRLNNLLGGNARVLAAHEACIAQHEKENAELLEILRGIEWEGATQEPQYPCCPVCARDETSGHYADCRLGRALATKEKHPMEAFCDHLTHGVGERYGLSDVFRGSAGSQKIMKHGGPDRARVIDRLDALLAQEEPPDGLIKAGFTESVDGYATDGDRYIEPQDAWRWFREQFGAAKTVEAEEGEQFRTAELAAQVKERNDMMSQGWLNNAFNPAPAFAVCGEHGYCQLPAGHDGEHTGPPSHQPSDAD